MSRGRSAERPHPRPGPRPAPAADGRPSAAGERALDAVMAHVAAHGLTDTSLRELAAAVGTSHRMLLYHFGSREGLVTAIVQRMETEQRDLLAVLAAQADSPTDLVRRQWQHLTQPAVLPFVKLFFEATALALHHRPGTGTFLAGLTDPWLAKGSTVARALGVEVDDATLRLGVAVLRGLLLDAVASGDPGPPGEALERYLQVLEQASEPPSG